jgi:hypothetical protein
MTARAHECLANARKCDSLATQAKDPLVKAGLQEAARHWRERAKRLEQQLVAESDRLIAPQAVDRVDEPPPKAAKACRAGDFRAWGRQLQRRWRGR